MAVVLFLVLRLFDSLLLFSIAGGQKIAPGWFELSAEKNPGFAFGLPLHMNLSMAVSGAIFLFLTYFFFSQKNFHQGWFVCGYAFVIAGGFLNFFERVRLGFVWDYFAVSLFGLRGVWNLADLSVLCGIGFWTWGFFFLTSSQHNHGD